MNRPEGMRTGELTLAPAGVSVGWPSQSSAEELAVVVQIRESWRAVLLGFYPGPDPGL